MIEYLLKCPEVSGKKLVLDADALYALGERHILEAGVDFADAILTPHPGEFSRLCGCPVPDIACRPMELVREYASRHKINILLKGIPTLVASASGTVLINNSGTEALATAGSGDVLAGMIGAICAKGIDTFNAGAAAAWFHGRAGDLADEVSSLVSSTDVLNAISRAVREIFDIGEE
jgi:hydroxyethylthiazole kinase-like uncharacterized protein yjeF